MRPAVFIESARGDLWAMPKRVRQRIGWAIDDAQNGLFPVGAKPLQGFVPPVREIRVSLMGDACRGVFVVQLVHAVYVLHCFKKKATVGIKTPQNDIDLVGRRLRIAEAIDARGA